MFRLAVTADLHHDVPKSRASAEALAATWPDTQAEGLLLVGDAATSDGHALEKALSLFVDDGRPRLFVPGNHEMWSRIDKTDVHELLKRELPRRVRDCGWHWLPGNPFRRGKMAVVGSLGWYDYGFALKRLGLPRRFYRAKLSPGAAAALHGDDLGPGANDVPEGSRTFRARWNDGRFTVGLTDDELFCGDRCNDLRRDLKHVANVEHVVAAVHVCPHEMLLPPIPPGDLPQRALKYAFARAYLGSPLIGRILGRRANVRHVVCGHSHVHRKFKSKGIDWLNIGSGYTEKRMIVIKVGAEAPVVA